jgi:hypothetical protein
MSISATTLYRQNSHEFYLDHDPQEQTIDVSRQATEGLVTSSSELEGKVTEIENPEEQDVLIVRVVKRAFSAISGLFSFKKNPINTEQVQINEPYLDAEEALDDHEVSSQEELFPGYAEAPRAQGEPEHELLSREMSLSAEAAIQTEHVEIKQESEGLPLSTQVSTFESQDIEVFSENLQLILNDLPDIVKNYFTHHVKDKNVGFILDRAEAHYLSIADSNLRRYSGLTPEDKIALALNKTRKFLENKYTFIQKK